MKVVKVAGFSSQVEVEAMLYISNPLVEVKQVEIERSPRHVNATSSGRRTDWEGVKSTQLSCLEKRIWSRGRIFSAVNGRGLLSKLRDISR